MMPRPQILPGGGLRSGRHKMISAADAVVWVNKDTREVQVAAIGTDRTIARSAGWGDPIGAAYSNWKELTDQGRIQLMLETAIDLTMQGFDLKAVLRAFADVTEFRALGSESYPMCRALSSALMVCLEPNTMSFEELLEAHP